MMWNVEYYDKNGNGFCGSIEPYIEPDFSTFQGAEACATELRKDGYINVKVVRDYSEKVYVIEVTTLDDSNSTTKISQKAYSKVDDAIEFCKTRADKPESVSDYTFRSDKYIYKILSLKLI